MRRLGLCASVLLLLLTGAVWADATLYRWVDDQGVVHYSDTPQPGAEKVHIAPAQTFSAPAVSASSAASVSPASPGAPQSCNITQPTPEQALYAPESVTVEVEVTPALEGSAQLLVSMDGAAVSGPQPSGHRSYSYQIPMVDRGMHTLTAEVRDASGHTLCNASPVTFYIQRPSLLSPTSPARGH